MPALVRSCIVAIACVGLAAAGDASPTPLPQPGQPHPQGPPQQIRMNPGRGMVTAFEVESLVVTAGDPAGLAAWADLAIRGYHVVGTVAQDGKTVLFFERNLPPNAPGAELALPAAVEKDPAAAAELRGKLLAVLAERRNAPPQRQPMPAPAPQPFQTPAPAPASAPAPAPAK